MSTGPVRVQDDGSWKDIDTTRVREGDRFVPRSAAADYDFSADGAGDFAALDGEDRKGRDVRLALSLGLGKRLPAPVVDGDTLTYRNVVPNGDLTVTAGATGFSHSLVLRRRPVGSGVLRLPAQLRGLSLSVTPAGGLEARDADGRVVYAAPQPRMWDSSVDPVSGEPKHTALVRAEMDTSGPRPMLVLTPDARLLADPDTVWPVTIDPTFTRGASDAWVQYPNYLSGQWGSEEAPRPGARGPAGPRGRGPRCRPWPTGRIATTPSATAETPPAGPAMAPPCGTASRSPPAPTGDRPTAHPGARRTVRQQRLDQRPHLIREHRRRAHAPSLPT